MRLQDTAEDAAKRSPSSCVGCTAIRCQCGAPLRCGSIRQSPTPDPPTARHHATNRRFASRGGPDQSPGSVSVTQCVAPSPQTVSATRR